MKLEVIMCLLTGINFPSTRSIPTPINSPDFFTFQDSQNLKRHTSMVDLQRTAYKSVSNREEVATKVAENV